MTEAYLSRLSLMGHPLRVGVLRLLVRHLPHGVAAGDIAAHLGTPPSTLSAHLSAMTDAGLLDLRKDGPLRLYRAAPDRLADALLWLSENVCLGRPMAERARLPRPFRLMFLCDDNAGLSLMAEALGRRRLAGRALVASAGLVPGVAPDPVMLELIALRRHDTQPLVPKPLAVAGPADIVIALTPGAAGQLPPGTGGPPPLCAFWPLEPAIGPRVIPRAAMLHKAYRALNSRLLALRRLEPGGMARAAVQAALDDLSSGLQAGGRACASLPERRRTSSSPALRASESS
ncbi:hypothetical protein AL036_16910 [Salipiger aestuarii]|uniref:helix-turn-helix domain-containing protein n=1 Tax=Salipiger aestuarii TaxID=568098 RepID=UPI00123B4C81|nr:helix-turn-helix domain-containing protein [Salipiger aestuarii]KAA8605864.1 hypothetical protein AL036_16910 [Salipiger aestuarii]